MALPAAEQLHGLIGTAASRLQTTRGVQVSASGRLVLYALASESLAETPEKWLQETGVASANQLNEKMVVDLMFRSLEIIVSAKLRVTTMNASNIVLAVSRQWCGVFPFCRK
jgi:hypothetical protein